MTQINDILHSTAILSNGEPRSAIDEACLQLGIPNMPEYVNAIDDGEDNRLVVLSAAATHFLTDRRLQELKEGALKEQVERFKCFLNKTMGKRGELRIFKPSNEMEVRNG